MGGSAILIVEDEIMLSEAVARRLIKLGYQVVGQVLSGEEAIEKALETKPDLVLMDIVLKGNVDGIQAAEQIRAKLGTPVVYMTAHSDSGTLERAKLTEPHSYLIKPVSEKDLRSTIETALYKYTMESRLKQSEERYRGVVEDQTELICRFTSSGRLTFVNEAFCKVFGRAREELLGQSSLPYICEEPAAGKPDCLQTLAGIRSAHRHEHRIAVGEGAPRWLEWTTRSIREPRGGIVEFQAVGRDITDRKQAEEALQQAHDQLEKRVEERTEELSRANVKMRQEIEERKLAERELKESEERFRTVVESALDCIFIKDRSLRYTLVNSYMETLFDLPASAILGRTDQELFGPEVGERLHEVDSRVLRGETIEKEDTRPVKGDPTTFLDTRAPMRNSKGQIVGVFGIARNITDRKHATPATPISDDQYHSRVMRETLRVARMASQGDSIVLLTGESGSGKDHLAAFIHNHSKRSGGPFFSINCSAVSPELAESELFGHEAGAFTGARGRKRGLLELAEGGTLLLNEIGELSPGLQAKLLTFLDTRSMTRVGGEKEITVNARLIAATNRDLENEVTAGRFRADLYYRLNVFAIRVPPLRERLEDLSRLVEEIVSHLATEQQLAVNWRIDSRTIEKLRLYNWPGNVRELRNVLERALIISRGGPLVLPPLRPEEIPDPESMDTFFIPQDKTFNEIVWELKVCLVRDALQQSGGNRSKAAKMLGISRASILNYTKALE